MTDNEIMKALECCETGDCIHCPRWKNGWISGDCSDLTTLALDLINRQKAEIAEYQKHIDQDIIYQKAVEVESIKEFAEKLKGQTMLKKMPF